MKNKKWAVILGATAGSGRAMAIALARETDLNIVGYHRGNHPKDAASLKEEIESLGKECLLRLGDASFPDFIESETQHLQKSLGPSSIPFFIHSLANASYGRFVSTANDQFHPKQFEKTFRSMAHSFVYWTQSLLKYKMLAPRSRILALGNPLVDSVVHGFGMIAASKMALDAYVRYMATELGPLGHRVNILKFGMVETDAVKIAFSPEFWSGLKERMKEVTPARRICTVEEVAKFVVILADPDVDWFNGATIDFTGGQVQSLYNRIFYSMEETKYAGDHYRDTKPKSAQ